ncbi:HAD-IA family hydrolase [Acerihabitans sp. TG2]|uniref:HAD family hydrolase n=1 Tax=Acerihabitans sp. TG2 TaxID=3096008 RepID=UPI002B227734|nr:HAD-IA family hydrolase [Acerihabitans sp. TG2]MEA9390383.1 HAD-IA family hydrolase [Acerihabitans sp. TG2]
MAHNDVYTMIVFDLDGTLLDTWPGLLAAVRSVLRSDSPELDPGALRLQMSFGIGAVLNQAVRQMGLDDDNASGVRIRILDAYLHQWLCTAKPYAGTQAMLHSLLSAGYTLGVCTNRDRGTTEALLAHLGWSALFSGIICLDECANAKPHPEPLLTLLSHCHCSPSHALFVGDSLVDAQCAARAQVSFAAHLQGYHSHPNDLFPCALAFSHASELATWVIRQGSSFSPGETSHG